MSGPHSVNMIWESDRVLPAVVKLIEYKPEAVGSSLPPAV